MKINDILKITSTFYCTNHQDSTKFGNTTTKQKLYITRKDDIPITNDISHEIKQICSDNAGGF